MARGLNHVYLLGALTREPELRYTPSGTPVLEFTVAGESEVLVSGGELKTLPWYHGVKLFGSQAESASELKAGQGVFVEAALEYSSWKADDSAKRSKLELLARRVEASPIPEDGLLEDRLGGLRLAGGINQALVIGNLTRAPDTRFTPGGEAVTALSLAINEGYKDKRGQWQERTHYLEITTWRDLAEACKELAKGDPVFAVGRLVSSAWEDAEGAKRYALKLEAERVERLERKVRAEVSSEFVAPEQPQPKRTVRAELRSTRGERQGLSRAARQR